MSSEISSRETVTIKTATVSDLPTLSKIQFEAFKSDLVSHIMTLDRPEDWSYSAWLERMNLLSFQDPEFTFVKAVDISTNKIVGWACWALKGTIAEDIDVDIETPSGAKSGESNGMQIAIPSETQESAGGGAAVTESTAPLPSQPPKPFLPRQVLSSLIGADSDRQYTKHMTSPSSRFLSKDGKHLILEGLFVHPESQKRGIGGALLERFSQAADGGGRESEENEEGCSALGKEPLPCWVHASPASWRLYERAGFKELERLEVDLGEVMSGGKADGERAAREEGSGWGVYVFRYMVREVKGRGM